MYIFRINEDVVFFMEHAIFFGPTQEEQRSNIISDAQFSVIRGNLLQAHTFIHVTNTNLKVIE